MNALAAVVLANAHVLTMDPATPRASVLAVVGERVAYVGDSLPEARKAAGPEAEILDVGGRTVVPGFNDAHVHFGLSLTLGSSDGADVPEGTRRAWKHAVVRAAEERPGGDWLFVQTRRLPDGIARADDIDFVARPMFVVTSHGGLLNHRALVAGGFSDDEAPDGFVRGRALAAALDRVVKRLPRARLLDGARAFLRTLAGLGITSVQLIDELPDVFETLRRSGELTARVRMIPLGFRLETRLYEPSWRAEAPEWLRVDGVKYFHDDGARLTRFELQELARVHTAAHRPIVVHVLSRHALDTLLDGIEAFAPARENASLFRIEHADEVTPAQAARLARLGIVVCTNPSMLPEWRRADAFPLRTLMRAGVRTCIGTDWVGHHVPPRPLSPLASLELAVTHGGYGVAERVTPAEALEAYTVGSAAAEGEAHDKGALTVGRLADLVVLSADPTTLPPEQIGAIEPLLTMVGGRVVHRDAQTLPPPSRTGPPPPTIGPSPTKRPSTIGPPRKQP
jgi:predicted amidohydrolase YtcJ